MEVGLIGSWQTGSCGAQLSAQKCDPLTLPDGTKVEYAEGLQTYEEPYYLMGATYLQPDGDMTFVRVLYPGGKLPAGGITKDQIVALVADPVFDH